MKLFNKLAFVALTAFALNACEDVPAPYTLPGDNTDENPTPEGVYINESFTNSFGSFSTTETEGNYPWVIDYGTAKATSYIDNANNAAQSWLISQPINLTNETAAYIKFDYIIRYAESGKVAANHQLLISDDYTGDAATTTWTDIPYNAVEGADWTNFAKAYVAIPEAFIGKNNITFALKYTAKTKASTWEVKNFIVAHGTVVEEEEESPEVKEYTVDEAKAAFVAGTSLPAILKCYIVGTINGQVYSSGCSFSASATANTNLLVAASPDETNPDNCMPVQLPSGAVRTALNLVNNPGNYKREIKLTGNIEKYFGVAGLKSVSSYEFIGEATDESTLPDGISSIASVFAAGEGNATIQGTISSTYARGFLVSDGTGSILVYLGEDKGYNEGDVVKVSGETSKHNGLLQFKESSTIEKIGTANVSHPTVTEMDGAAMDAYLESPSIKYIKYRGVLTIDGYYYNVEIADSETAVGSISYPKDGLIDASLNGKEIIVTGYAIGVSRSEFVNTMAIVVEAAE